MCQNVLFMNFESSVIFEYLTSSMENYLNVKKTIFQYIEGQPEYDQGVYAIKYIRENHLTAGNC